MMANMSPDDMQRMMNMSKNMDPSMMAQAQQMMSNPAMAKQAADAMSSMSPSEMKEKLDQSAQLMGNKPAAPPAPAQTVVQKLKASPMSVPAEVIEAVEEAEGFKSIGNKKFKEADYAAAAGRYEQGTKRLEGVSGLGGADKKAVAELKEMCHLNLANCRLKLEQYDDAKAQCDTVLAKGDNRKAYFRRGVAYQKLNELDKARDDLKKAVEMDSTDATVVASLREVESAIGCEPTKVEKPPAAAPVAAPTPPVVPPGMPGGPGMPDPAQMEKMLDNITPEQMKQQAEMLESMDPSTLSSMAPQLGGVSADQLKMVSGMMKNMDPATMKSMAKMAQSMQASGAPMPGMPAALAGGGGGGGGGGGASGGAGGMPDLANMSMDQGMEMMDNMNPDMMKAGMEMMKNMDPKAMASMSKAMGREISEDQMAQMQQMMGKMSPEDMEKWSKRAATAATWMKKPIALYQQAKAYGSQLGSSGALAIVAGVLAVMAVGHFTDAF